MDKKVMKMDQIINEQKLREIVREELRKVIDDVLLSEMALSLSDFRRKAADRIQQILTNWCLVRYARYDESVKNTRNNWATELYAVMYAVGSVRLKKGKDIDTKQNALFKVWSDFEVDRDESAIHDLVCIKFESEGIDTNSGEYIQTITDCKNATRDIVGSITSGDRATILKYIRTI